MKWIAGFVLGLAAFSADATEQSSTSEIVRLISYAEYGGGDVVFQLGTPAAQCSTGYWLKKSDPGFDATMSMLIAAYQTKSPVIVTGHTDQLWTGSSSKYCHMYHIEYRR